MPKTGVAANARAFLDLIATDPTLAALRAFESYHPSGSFSRIVRDRFDITPGDMGGDPGKNCGLFAGAIGFAQRMTAFPNFELEADSPTPANRD